MGMNCVVDGVEADQMFTGIELGFLTAYINIFYILMRCSYNVDDCLPCSHLSPLPIKTPDG